MVFLWFVLSMTLCFVGTSCCHGIISKVLWDFNLDDIWTDIVLHSNDSEHEELNTSLCENSVFYSCVI